MPQWIVDLVGQSLAPIVWVAIVAIAVCLLAMLMIVLAKKAFGGRIGTGYKGNAPRLAVMDVARIDEKRRLILVRRDEVEHLVLVGGQNDVLLEGNILPVPASASIPVHERPGAFVEFEEAAPGKHVAPAAIPHSQAPRPTPEPRQKDTASAQLPAVKKDDLPSATSSASASPVPPPFPETKPSGTSMNGNESAPTIDPDHSPQQAARLGARRSIVTPTRDLRPSPSKSDVQISPASSSKGDAAASQASPASDRREPMLTVPEVRSEPTVSGPERLRAQMNRSQSPAVERVQDATAPAIAVDSADRRQQPRQPLSVRSFATAIQNRKAPPEMPQPSQRVAETSPNHSDAQRPDISLGQRDPQPSFKALPDRPAPIKEANSAPNTPPVAEAEPSLEDFLSAEIDSGFGNDAFFADEPSRPTPGDDAPTSTTSETPSSRSPTDQSPAVEIPPGTASTPAVAAVAQTAPQPGAPLQTAASPEKLTLEDEMERLLGDFDFGDGPERKAN